MNNVETTTLTLPQQFELLSVTDERVALASRALSKTCVEKGIKVSSWREFGAWCDYVEGKINEPQLTEGARRELERHSESFGKYVLLESEAPPSAISDIEKRKRAKRAKKIYANICRNTGLTLCFFHNFSAWSDFVSGKIDELEFLHRVAAETSKMSEEDQP